ncbi:MAG: methyl-accepting chemotaxis protein [Rhizomicrobium sp.]|nr:methyl-accepting chemotaxis protein [Rhizomicrobium sp.]
MNRLTDYSVVSKIVAAFAMVLFATFALGIFANVRLHAVNTNARALGERWLPDMQQLGQLQYTATRLRSWQGAVLMSTSPEKRTLALAKLEALRAKTATLVQEFAASTDSDEEKALGTRVSQAWAAYEPMLQTELAIEKEKGQAAAFEYYMSTMMSGFEELRMSFEAALEYHNRGGAAATAAGDATYLSSQLWIYAAMALAAALSLLAGLMLIRSVSTPLVKITGAMGELAGGNLDVHVPYADQADEIGTLAGAMNAFKDQLAAADRSKAEQTAVIVASIGEGLDHLAKGNLTHRIAANLTGPFVKLKEDFNLAMARLQDTVKQVLGTTGQIAVGAGEIAQAADDLSRRTEHQAASLEETSAALEEITATVKKTAANTNQVNISMASARSAAENGGKVVQTATLAMDAISQSSKKITDIIGVIDEIAFQTNLLALNAGVEAARAGDAGRGFAVVASEVRALAQRSSEAAKQIKTLIHASGEQVADGVKHVGATGEALQHIVEQVQQINLIVHEMAQATEQEATGIEQVNAAVGQMDQVTQQNAAMVEQSTAASRNLVGETQHLQSLVAFFEVGQETRLARTREPQKSNSRPTAKPAPQTIRRVATAGRAASAVRPGTDEWSEF